MNKKRLGLIFAIITLIYISYFLFAACFLNTGEYPQAGLARDRIFSTNKGVHLFARRVYSPLRYLVRRKVHFLTEDEFEGYKKSRDFSSDFYNSVLQKEREKDGSVRERGERGFNP